MNFKREILANFEFWGYQICQQTVNEITKFHSHFQLKSKQEPKVKITSFSGQLVQISQKDSQPTKNKLMIAFDNGILFQMEEVERWHCLSHKDLIIKSIKTNNYWFIFVL